MYHWRHQGYWYLLRGRGPHHFRNGYHVHVPFLFRELGVFRPPGNQLPFQRQGAGDTLWELYVRLLFRSLTDVHGRFYVLPQVPWQALPPSTGRLPGGSRLYLFLHGWTLYHQRGQWSMGSGTRNGTQWTLPGT